jgi:signal transduction histidine kinase
MKLKTQILLILISISIAIISISGILNYYNYKKTFLSQIYNQLESLSQTKKSRLNTFLTRKQEQLMLVKNRPEIQENLVKLLADPDSLHLNAIDFSLRQIKKDVPSFENIYIVGLNGMVKISTDKKLKTDDFSNRISFKHALKGEECLHDIYFKENKMLCIYMASPLKYQDKVVGIIVIATSADDISSITNDYTGLGKTGETVLARFDRYSNVEYLTPMRFYPKPFFRVAAETNHVNFAMKQALLKKEKIFNSDNVQDYRKHPVIASTRFIEKTGWGMVTKIDRKEVFEPLTQLRNMTILIGLAAIIIFLVLSFLFAAYLAKPINEIANTAKQISKGDLSKRLEVTNSINELNHLVFSFNRMTESLILAREGLEKKVEQLDRSNEALDRFAYIVSHDLKAPLSAITSLSEFLKSDYEDKIDDEGKKILEMIEQKIDHMHELINGVLEYSRISAGQSLVERIDMNEIIGQVIENIAPSDHIKISIVDKLPVLNIERTMVLQIFQNLLSNAVKYMDKPLGMIKVGSVIENEDIKFSVADNGPGIPLKYFDKIFEIFNKVQHNPKADSTGIGLAIVKKIVEQKGGRIWVESEVGKGSVFYCCLPKAFLAD